MKRVPGQKTVVDLAANLQNTAAKVSEFSKLSWELTNSGSNYASGTFISDESISSSFNGLENVLKPYEWDVTGMWYDGSGITANPGDSRC